MNDSGAIHGDGRYDSLLHEVHQNRTQSDFDDMGAKSHDDGPAFAMSRRNRFGDRAQCFDAEDIRQRTIELAEAASTAPRPAKSETSDLAVPFLERIGREIRHIDRRDQRSEIGRGGRCRSGGFGKELFLDEFTQDVAERDVAFLNAGRDRRWDDERIFHEAGQLSAGSAGPADRGRVPQDRRPPRLSGRSVNCRWC